MKIVGVLEGPTEPCSELLADGGLARAGYPHDGDDHSALRYRSDGYRLEPAFGGVRGSCSRCLSPVRKGSGLERPNPDFVQVPQEVTWVLVYTVRASSLELLFAVAAREEPHADGARSPRRAQVPPAIADDHPVGDCVAEAARGLDASV